MNKLLKYLRQTGRFNFTSGTNYSKASSNLSLEDRTDENIIQLKLNFSIAGTKIEDQLLINFEE